MTHIGCDLLRLLVGYGVVASAVGCAPTSSQPGKSDDLVDFNTFTYEQLPALGFCPDLQSPYAATFQRMDNGGYRMTMSVIEEGQRGVDACSDLSGTNSTDCFVIRSLTPRDLTGIETQRVLAAFADVRIAALMVLPPVCVDPCSFETFTWDEFSLASSLVGCIGGRQEYLDPNERQEIIQLLKELGGSGNPQ